MNTVIPSSWRLYLLSLIQARITLSLTLVVLSHNSSMNLVYEDDSVRVKGIKRGMTSFCSISFTGVGHAMGGINIQREEFVGSCMAIGDALFVSDKMRSWGNSINPEKLAEVFSRWSGDTAYEKVISIGNSMGGTNALLLGPLLGAHSILAFAPQYSVHHDYFPSLGDARWDEYRNKIRNWRFKTVDALLPSLSVDEYIFSGGTSSEIKHARLFRKVPKRSHWIIKDSDHGVAMFLKKHGCLPAIINLVMCNANTEQIEAVFYSKNIAFERIS